MHILVNALSVTNFSGRHVLLGHLSRIAPWSADRHKFIILHHKGNSDIIRNLEANVHWIECPEYTKHWIGRTLWEILFLPSLALKMKANLLLTTSGTVMTRLSIPQISYAMNPWCLVPKVHQKPAEKIKARLQRWAYKQAIKKAYAMVFLSDFMRQAYRKNAGFQEAMSEVVYTGIDEEIDQTAKPWRDNPGLKKPKQVLCVSVMAPHKGIETLVRAIDQVRRIHSIPAELLLVGPWSDKDYLKKTRGLISQLELEDVVTIKGHVPTEELHRHYAESKIFCLMSWCESFGIPSVEAQAYGTPAVSSNCCAIPEVCGKGGVYPEPGDVEGTAEALAHLLTDEKAWSELSLAAIENSKRFQWDLCSRPLMQLIDSFSENYKQN